MGDSEGAAAEAGGEQQQGGDGGYTPPATQDDLNRIIADRVSRERAKFGDYKELKAKAARLDEIEQANKSELEKATERISAAEQARDGAVAESLRLRVAAKHGIGSEDADLFLTGSDEETLKKQAERLIARDGDRKKNNNHVPREGTNPATTGAGDEREFVRELFGSGG